MSDTPLPTATAEVPVVMSKNVFRPSLGQPLRLDFRPQENGRVRVRVFNLAGELVRTPFEADVRAGLWFQATWSGQNDQGERVASGVYFVSVKGGGIRSVRKVVVIQ